MKPAARRIFAFFAMSAMLAATLARAQESPYIKDEAAGKPPKIAAEAYVLMDFESGEIIASKNAHARRAPASLAKIMTAHVVFNAIKNGEIAADQIVRPSTKAWKMGGSRMFIEPRHRVPVEELLRGMMAVSGNDAAMALAETVAGGEKEFAVKMNAEAARLGLENSRFASVTGLYRKNQYSTAYDLAQLSRAQIKIHPQGYANYSIIEYSYNDIDQKNRNSLLNSYPGADGIKTGHTRRAGYCLAASAVQGGWRLVAVVLGAKSADSRRRAAAALLNFGFARHRRVRAYHRERRNLRLWGGAQDEVAARVAGGPPFVVVAADRARRVRARFVPAADIVAAPIAAGQQLGTLEIFDDGDGALLARRAVLAEENIARGGWVKEFSDEVKLRFLGHKDANRLSQW